MKSRTLLYSGVFAILLLCFTELLLRIGLAFLGYPILRPSDYLYTRFYDNMQKVRETDIRRGDVKNVLILGGSVVSTPWTHMENRLDTILQKRDGRNQRYAFYNIASAGHTSLDNALKYKLLEDKRFDLVIYYEAINENRANNVPTSEFRSDYTHIKWYCDIDLLRKHTEINLTVIPYLIDKLICYVKDRLDHRIYISADWVDPQFAKFGGDIKTVVPYRKNLESIINTARKRGDKLLLMSYASYFPQNVALTGKQQDMSHYACCHFASPVTIWGNPENVKKGIAAHNQVLRTLARQHKTLYFDMENSMPKDGKFFCDVCHVSEPGAQVFAHQVVEFIIRSQIL